jgi:pantoate--beta-alanine ligase
MRLSRSLHSLRQFAQQAPRPIVLVPTMGALHEGHAALIKKARGVAGKGGSVVGTIFVNPAQFGPREDFKRYPRGLAADRRLCAQLGVDLLFAPDVKTMYHESHSTFVEELALSSRLCGASRPAHFRGVCTIVLKLFALIQPDAAVFGRKDFQQLAVIQRMVRDLNLAVRIVPVETVREPDGLALSSRNRYLSPVERKQAPTLQKALKAGERTYLNGERRASRLRTTMLAILKKAPLARVDYLEIIHGSTLEPTRSVSKGTVFAVAAFFGGTRLIDNLRIRR